MTELCKRLQQHNIEYIENEPMKAHTTFKIGGAADVYLTVRSVDELRAAVAACRDTATPWMILGKGSNLLVSDEGIEGAVIALDGEFKSLSVDGDTIACGAALSLSKLCTVAAEHNLSGLEFAYGIPGSVGGAVYMNAGAYGGETKDVVAGVTCMTPDGTVRTLANDQLGFDYRTSVFKSNEDIILFAKYKLTSDSREAILARMEDYMNRRRTKQPLEFPSAGSTFKRPAGAFAGTLIEQCGLKGRRVGGAEVSEKHAGFIINAGNATCADVQGLVKLVQDTVRDQTGYELECEIIRTGR